MDSSSIDLPGSEIGAIRFEGGTLRVRFSKAYIVKTMTGSVERTRWWQAGDLVLEGAQVDGDLPQGVRTCAGGDVVENIFTYRDMIPIPLNSRGHARVRLAFRGTDQVLSASGEGVRLELEGVPKYIEHLRPSPAA
jgi:hypothetical protein